LALAAAVLSISFISSNSVIPVIVASGVISLGILIWSFEWKIEKLRAVDKKNSTRLSWVRIFSVMCALSVLISLLYARPLPWLGERAIEVGQSVKEILPSYDKINERIRNRLTDDPSDQEKSPDISKGFGDRRELPKSGSITLSEDEIISYTRTQIAAYKCPKSIEFIKELPRNPSGKILRRELRDPYWEGIDRKVSGN